MGASVRIEGAALSDIRIKYLGQLLGTGEYDALGRMAHVWSACVEQGTYFLAKPPLSQIVDPDKLVAAKLAHDFGDDVYICGSIGRVEWLSKARASGKANGQKGGKYGKLGGRPKKPPNGVGGKPPGGVIGNPLTVTVTDTVTVNSPSETRARKARATALPAGWVATDSHRSLASELGVDLESEAAKFRSHAEANDRRQVRWDSAFCVWLRNAAEYRAARKPAAGGQTRPAPVPPYARPFPGRDEWGNVLPKKPGGSDQ